MPLGETGLVQAKATGRRMVLEWQPATIYSSLLSRTVKTAEAIASQFELPVQTHPDLFDIDDGEWQGLMPDVARELWPEQARIPGGELLADEEQLGEAAAYAGWRPSHT